jgi:TonB family protein
VKWLGVLLGSLLFHALLGFLCWSEPVDMAPAAKATAAIEMGIVSTPIETLAPRGPPSRSLLLPVRPRNMRPQASHIEASTKVEAVVALLAAQSDSGSAAGGPTARAPSAAPENATENTEQNDGAAVRTSEATLEALVHARLQTAATSCYPATARRFHLTGKTVVSFCVGLEGRAHKIAVSQSSGTTVLDEAATQCVIEKSLPFPLETSGHCFEGPVNFGL